MKSLFLVLSLFPLFTWAHGDDKPGPHGGHVQMPGAFHTELVIAADRTLRIYLTDMEFKNPSVKDSKVDVKFVSGKKEVKFNCAVMGGNHFHCSTQSKYPNKGELRVTATREKAAGQEVIYKLPLADQSIFEPANKK